MILSQRKVHFWVWMSLTGLLPTVFLAGLIGRPEIPIVDKTSDELFALADFFTRDAAAMLASETVNVNGIDVQLAIMDVGLSSFGESVSDNLALTVTPSQPLSFSNTLVYWVPAETVPEILPEPVGVDAVLLGQLSGDSRRQFAVVPDMLSSPGYLLFYSHGQGVVIAATSLPTGELP